MSNITFDLGLRIKYLYNVGQSCCQLKLIVQIYNYITSKIASKCVLGELHYIHVMSKSVFNCSRLCYVIINVASVISKEEVNKGRTNMISFIQTLGTFKWGGDQRVGHGLSPWQARDASVNDTLKILGSSHANICCMHLFSAGLLSGVSGCSSAHPQQRGI